MDLPAEIEVLVLAELGKQVKKHLEPAKAAVGSRYPAGHKETFRSPVDDAKLGQIWRTDPDPEWRITDREALHKTLSADSTNLAFRYDITDHDAAVQVLLEHAPHLLAEVCTVDEHAIAGAIAAAKQGETVPGVERVKPAGVLTVRADPNAGAAIEKMVAAGVINWRGQPAQVEAAS